MAIGRNILLRRSLWTARAEAQSRLYDCRLVDDRDRNRRKRSGLQVVNSVLLKPLNYPKAEELVALHQTAPGAEGLADFENGLLLSPSMYYTYAEHNQTFQSLGVWAPAQRMSPGLQSRNKCARLR